MRKDKVKVIVWGLGSMGKGMVEMLVGKKGVEIVGGVVRGDKIGKSMFDFLELERNDHPEVILGSYEDVIAEGPNERDGRNEVIYIISKI